MRDISYIKQKIYKNIFLLTKKRVEAVVAASKTEVKVFMTLLENQRQHIE